MSQYYDKDVFHWPIEITETTDTFVVHERYEDGGSTIGSGDVVVEIDSTADLAAGSDWYAVYDSNDGNGVQVSPDLRVHSLYEEILNKLKTASDAAGHRPTDAEVEYTFGSDSTGKKLTLEATPIWNAGSNNDLTITIRLEFDNPSFTMDPRIFGYDQNRTSATSEATSGFDTDFTAAELESPYTRDGIWISPVAANDKRSEVESRVFESSSINPFRSYANAWNATYVNRFYYRNVIGPEIWPHDRTGDATNQTLFSGEFIHDDPNHSLYRLWNNARLNQNIMVNHNETLFGLFNVDSIANVWRLQRMRDVATKQSFRAMISDFQRGGEVYDVDFRMAYLPYDEYDSGFQAQVWRH